MHWLAITAFTTVLFLQNSFAIIDGERVKGDRYPALLWVMGKGTCTATLIGPQVFLTAAHCLDDLVDENGTAAMS